MIVQFMVSTICFLQMYYTEHSSDYITCPLRSLQWCTIFIKLSPNALDWHSRISLLRPCLSFLALSTLYLCHGSARNLAFPEVNHISLWLYFCFFFYFSPTPVPHSLAKKVKLLIVNIASVRATMSSGNHKVSIEKGQHCLAHLAREALFYPLTELTIQPTAPSLSKVCPSYAHMDIKGVILFLALYYCFS